MSLDLKRVIICACVAATLGGASTSVRAADGKGAGSGVRDQGVGAPGVRLDPLGAARTLYLAAAYEDALAALADLPPETDSNQADKFRALCLLALNRTDDARRALARLATRQPMLELDASESPKLVSMFREARAQVLPAAVKALYGAAKSSFERGDLTMAGAQFGDVIRLISENELAGDAALADIKLVAEGFSELANHQLSAQNLTTNLTTSGAGATPPAVVTVTSTPASAGGTSPAPTRAVAAVQAAVIYSADDGNVVAPVVIDETLPRWMPPTVGDYRSQTFSGSLELIIDETGGVVSVTLVQRLNAMYDQLLVHAARRWRYRPAVRNGQPVRYRKQIHVVLHPSGAATEQSEPRKD